MRPPFSEGSRLRSLSKVSRLGGIALLAIAAAAVLSQTTPSAPPIQADDVLDHLKQTVAWYRRVVSLEQIPYFANDPLLKQDVHNAAVKALQLAFDFGRAAAAISAPAASAPAQTTPGGSRSLTQAAAKASARVDALQSRLKELDTAIQTAKVKDRPTLQAQQATLRVELDLATQVRDTVRTLAAFSTNDSDSLAVQINRLEQSVPEAAHDRNANPSASQRAPAAAAAAPAVVHPESAGIIGLVTQLFALSRNRSQVRDVIAEADQLVQSLNRLRTPMINEARTMLRWTEESDSNSATDVQALQARRAELEAIMQRFKQLSAVLVPLGEQAIVLGTVRSHLTEAEEGIAGERSEALRYLLLRLGALAGAIGGIMLLSAFWRRVTFRYVHDPRRRVQFLTLRRVAVAIAVLLTIVLSFVTEFGSLATYAGLLTAGIAVALQNVILAVVGYFFLIGRYGIRSGDRVTVGGVTGTVIDIGLVRIYMAELTEVDGELHPTGRVVVYSNSILFQPSALFKQLPGTDYVWHSVHMTLTPDSDAQLAERRLKEAAAAVYERHRMGVGHEEFEMAMHSAIDYPQPVVRIEPSAKGLEVTIRYRVDLRHAATIDAELLQAFREVVQREPRLNLADHAEPELQTERS
jgi:small-conductance mechanosensitive channel